MSGLRTIGLMLLLALVGGCASIPGEPDPRDPLESYNRGMFKFNRMVDDAIMKPVAKGYKAITPEFIDRGITNFFSNLRDINSAINNLLQFKLSRAASDVGRLAVNSTVGVFGFFDVATNMGLPNYKEDFGQTFGYWGDDSSPYLVLPLLGPSTLRDTFGLGGDSAANPLFYLDDKSVALGLMALDKVDARSDFLTSGKTLDDVTEASGGLLDPYTLIRDAYLQHRRNKIFDGAPPEEADIFETDEPGRSCCRGGGRA